MQAPTARSARDYCTVLTLVTVMLGCQDLSSPTGVTASASDQGALLTNGGGAFSGYEMVPLRLGGLESYATDINNRGAVTGGVYRGSPFQWETRFEAFVWNNGTVQFLGTLGGANSFANAINDLGEVTGTSTTADGQYHAFVWSPGRGMEDIGPGEGHGINANGVVVGTSGPTAFRWTRATGRQVLLPLRDGYQAVALDINRTGVAVGSSLDATGRRAVLWAPDGSGPKDLGTLGGDYSEARAIADNGVIVGTSSTASYLAPFRWTPRGGMEALTMPGYAGNAVGVSLAGAVGESSRFDPPPSRFGTGSADQRQRCLWLPNGWCRPVSSDGTLSAINDSGVIAGVMPTSGQYGFAAVVWRPVGARW
jgi:probable HAF family extracellular repeat protein